jgi:transposase
MQAITTVGLDIAKSVFQVHAIDAEGNVIVRRQKCRRRNAENFGGEVSFQSFSAACDLTGTGPSRLILS